MPAIAFKNAVYPQTRQALSALELAARALDPSSAAEICSGQFRAERQLLQSLNCAMKFCAMPTVLARWPEATRSHRSRVAELMDRVEQHLKAWSGVALIDYWSAYRAETTSLLDAAYDFFLLQDAYLTLMIHGNQLPSGFLLKPK